MTWLHPSFRRHATLMASLCAVAITIHPGAALGEPAPVPFRTITPEISTDAMRESFVEARSAQVRDVEVTDAKWLQLRFT